VNAIVSSSTRPARNRSSDCLLRLGLSLDAWISGAFGLVLLAGGGLLNDALGMSATFLWAVGGVCLAYAGVLWLLQISPVSAAPAGWSVVVANSIWVTASLVLLVLGPLRLTPLGIGFVVLQALAVGSLTCVQLVGVRRARQAHTLMHIRKEFTL
jgi:hypothetical protein